MGWQLAPGTGYGKVGDELIFLDLRRDRYLALRGGNRAAFERLRGGEPNDSDAMSALLQTGLISRRDGATCLDPADIGVPEHDLSARDDRFSWRMAVAAAVGLHWARRAMRPRKLATTLEARAKKGLAVAPPASEQALIAVAARYAASRWAVPVERRCLVDALALDHIMRRRGLVATLVFGVRLDPFAAHCWLQTRETILTGAAAEARNFTPILVAT